jgi:transposase
MLSLSNHVKVFLTLQPADMRKSFDSLAALVHDVLQLDPLSGHLFVFRSKRCDRIKILYWDAQGYALWYRRLEIDTFRFPIASEGTTSLAISATGLAMLLDSVELTSVRRGGSTAARARRSILCNGCCSSGRSRTRQLSPRPVLPSQLSNNRKRQRAGRPS